MVGVMLGMPGPWADDNSEAADHYTTKVGGVPDWPFQKTYIMSDLLECGVCGKRLCLVAQVHAPLMRNCLALEERTIYIFGCVKPECGSHSSSWRVLRAQKSSMANNSSSAVQEVSSLPSSSGSNWWGEDLFANGFAGDDGKSDDEDFDLQELGRALSEAASLAATSIKHNDNKHNKDEKYCKDVPNTLPSKDPAIPVVPCFYIYPQEEKFSAGTSATYVDNLSLLTERINDVNDKDEGETWNEESYEYDRALNVDRTYLKFKKRVDVYPDQCFRYSYGGKPLLAAPNVEKPQNCSNCNEARHFEMQLMPPLLYFLQQNDDPTTYFPEAWNWMTLMVFTCSKSCSQRPCEGSTDEWTIVEEAIIIQSEDSMEKSVVPVFFT